MDEPREIGDWIAVSELGSGAFGVVTLWKNQNTNEFIAVKKCRFKMTSQLSKRQRERWTNEVRIMQSIKNDNIVGFKDLPDVLNEGLSKFNPTNLPLLSMEYCRKGNLRKYLQQSENVKGLNETEVRCVLGDLCSAVSYLHGVNVTHRDIKPENIVLQESNERPNKTIYKLIDLGYAKELETLVQSFVGTLHYLAPEIFETDNYNYKVDYWSLGIVAFEIITGVHPFLHHLPPAERFKYIKNKSPNDICMHIGVDGKVKSYSQIVLENRIGQVLKARLESWLKLMLQYKPEMRGVRGGQEVVEVFRELKDVLGSKILRVFSVYDFERRTYEIEDDTSISEVKKLIDRDLNIPEGDQVFLAENFHRDYDNVKLKGCFPEINHETTIYVFRRDECVKAKVIALPEQVQMIFNSGQKELPQVIQKQLSAFSLYFISQENELLDDLRNAFYLQMDYVKFLFKEEMKLFRAARGRVEKLAVEIECLDDINRKFVDFIDLENEKCSRNLVLYRKYLRQSKELFESVNSLTERHLKISKKEETFQRLALDLKTFLDGTSLNQTYLDAFKLYNLRPTVSVQDMTKVLSNVIKIKFRIPKCEILKDYLSMCWKLTTAFRKRFAWMEALGRQIDEISSRLRQNSCDKCDLLADRTVEVKTTQKVRVSFGETDGDDDSSSANNLIKENVLLRYEIQDLVNNALIYHQYALNQVLCNGLKQDQSAEDIHVNSTYLAVESENHFS